MGFSLEVKSELTSIGLADRLTNLSELIGLVRTNSTLSIDFQNGMSLKFETTGANIARRIFKLVKSLYNYEPNLAVLTDDRLKRKNLYQVSLEDDISRYLLEDAGFSYTDFGYLSEREDFSLIESVHAKAFLRGAFLGAGTVVNPKKSYQLEIICESKASQIAIAEVAAKESIEFKKSERGDQFVLYLRDSNQISDFLSLIGANNAMLEFENIRVMKDLKNKVNRIVNAETANINKTVSAAVRQIEAIEKIERTVGLKSLDENLRELSILRLANPEDSLKSLGEKLDEPIGKSGVSHRFKKIEEIAKDL